MVTALRTLEDTALHFGLTKNMVAHVERVALRKLRARIKMSPAEAAEAIRLAERRAALRSSWPQLEDLDND